jgi:hypothetical protein
VWACRCARRGHIHAQNFFSEFLEITFSLAQKFFLNFWKLTFPGRGLNICCKIFLGKIFLEKKGVYLSGYEKQSG